MTEPRQWTRGRLRQYLLDQAREEDRVALEDAYFADDEFLEELEAAEADLVDDYVRGRLTGADGASFEARCQSSSRLLERVAFARQLAGRPSQAPPATRWWTEAWSAVRCRPVLATGMAAAVLLLATTLGWWAWQPRPGTGVQETLRAGAPATAQRVPDERARGGTPAAAPTASAERPPGRVLALVLVPGLVRAAGDVMTLAIGPDDHAVEMRLEHEGPVRAEYRAAIRTPEGKTAWEQAGLKPVAPAAPAVLVAIPATALPAGDYIVTLTSIEPGRPPEIVAEYAFRAVRR